MQKGLAPTLRCCFSAGCYFCIVFRFVHWTCWVEILQWEERDYTRHTTAHCENSERNPVRHLRCSAAPANLTPNTDKSVDTPVFQVKFSAWFHNCNINHLLVFPQIMLKVMSPPQQNSSFQPSLPCKSSSRSQKWHTNRNSSGTLGLKRSLIFCFKNNKGRVLMCARPEFQYSFTAAFMSYTFCIFIICNQDFKAAVKPLSSHSDVYLYTWGDTKVHLSLTQHSGGSTQKWFIEDHHESSLISTSTLVRPHITQHLKHSSFPI